MWLLIAQRLVFDWLLDAIYFPIWWYSAGAKRVLFGCWYLFQDENYRLAPLLWLKNLFVPMFNQHDLQGRFMSIFIRFINIIFRMLFLIILMMVLILWFLLWLVFPLFLIAMLWYSFV